MPLKRETVSCFLPILEAMLQNIMISLFSGTHAAKENESFCFIYHSVIIEKMCFAPHSWKKKISAKTHGVKSGAKYFCHGLSERDYLNGGRCEDVCDRLGQQDRLWCVWNTAVRPSTVKMMNGWKFLWVTLNWQWLYIRQRFFVRVHKKYESSDHLRLYVTKLHVHRCMYLHSVDDQMNTLASKHNLHISLGLQIRKQI